jgi:hypothetical protein
VLALCSTPNGSIGLDNLNPLNYAQSLKRDTSFLPENMSQIAKKILGSEKSGSEGLQSLIGRQNGGNGGNLIGGSGFANGDTTLSSLLGSGYKPGV